MTAEPEYFVTLIRPSLSGPIKIQARVLSPIFGEPDLYQIQYTDRWIRQPLAKKCHCGNFYLPKESRGECAQCAALQFENAH